ncbi:pyruvate kinase 1 cytosolic-like isoform X2 [Prunus yedoensis var. nudiflora]|uniref:Pyruvate kinase n=1 Tax=Prunus yedoensis var. nudiflora TaxID=2094558 RepID=A0A314YM80_PRUYE|nr:pyruvate kinase 1 cytosolic-like isoform X2 [Prunus yedoensis var. nudiflora]
MHSNHLLLEEPIRMASILESSKSTFFPAMSRIVGTLGINSQSVETISACLKAGMSVARFDFSWGDAEFHQKTLENLKIAIKSTKKLCAVMLDTVGPELQVVNKSERPVSLQEETLVVKKGDTIFIGQYLFTGSETTSVWLEVTEVNGEEVVCLIKNSATLSGPLYTLHVSQIRIDLPTLTDKDKEVISTWGVRNNIDFLSLSYTRHAEDVRHVRTVLPVMRSDAILLGAETLRGLYPVETISIVGKICAEAEKVFNQDLYFKRAVKYVGEPMTHLESIASSASLVLGTGSHQGKASVIICFTSSGRAARLIAKYRPTMPVLSVVIPWVKTNQLRWKFSGAFEARQSRIVRGLFPMLADPRHPAESTGATNESILKVALDYGKYSGLVS